MKHQASRTIALMLGVMLAAAPAAQAGTITYGELVRSAGASGQSRPATDVRLRLGAQSPATVQAGSTQSGAASSQEQQTAEPNGSTSVSASADPTISQSGGQIQTIDLGDVTGTVCDCGEIPPNPLPAAGAFPWWALAGIPLICVSGICAGGDDEEVVPPTITNPPTTPTPPVSTPVPEPLSLLLFGSGLLAVGARARRRRSRKQPEGELYGATTEED